MNLENVKIGPCHVYINDVSIGATKGGVQLAVEYTIEDNNYLGSNPNYDRELKMTSVKITVPLAETTLDNLQKVIPWASKTTDGLKQLVKIHSDSKNLRDYAVVLKLVPINAQSDNDVVTIYKAIPVSGPSYTYEFSERVYSTTFEALCKSATDTSLIGFGDQSLES